MGYRLYREVLEHAPADITSGELLVWLIVADDASDTTRCGWIDQDELARRARMSPAGVKKALQRLGTRGFELRIARGVDAKGRPVFAYRGAQTTYRLPQLVDNSEKGGTVVPASGEKGGTTVPERGDRSIRMGGPQSPPSPQFPQSPQSSRARDGEPVENPATQIIKSATDATNAEATAVAALIDTEKQPRNATAFIRRLADDGELAEWLDRVRADASREAVREFIARIADLPECLHGVNGGGQFRPDSGEPQCAQCRAAHRRRSA
jgi:hypothetical protein